MCPGNPGRRLSVGRKACSIVRNKPGRPSRVSSTAQGGARLLVPGYVLIVRPEGTQVAVVGPEHIVPLKKIEVGRDGGDKLEILSGIEESDTIIPISATTRGKDSKST